MYSSKSTRLTFYSRTKVPFLKMTISRKTAVRVKGREEFDLRAYNRAARLIKIESTLRLFSAKILRVSFSPFLWC